MTATKKAKMRFLKKLMQEFPAWCNIKYGKAGAGGGAELTEDVVQEIMKVISDKYKKQALPQDHLIQWIFKVANNKILEFIRKSYNRINQMDSLNDISSTLMSADDLEQEEIDAELNDLIYRALKKMSDRCKEIIKALLDQEKKEYIAGQKLQSIPEGTISARIHHCRKNFRKVLIREGFTL